jgi:hypothetical protein
LKQLLGLVPDIGNPEYYDPNDFWRGLNESWLFALASGLQHEEDLRLSESELQVLRSNVIAWSDILELYGLVDYELGFWEQDILDSIDMQLERYKERQSPSGQDILIPEPPVEDQQPSDDVQSTVEHSEPVSDSQ